MGFFKDLFKRADKKKAYTHSIEFDEQGDICYKKKTYPALKSEAENEFERIAGFPYDKLHYISYPEGGGYIAMGTDIETILYAIKNKGCFAFPF